MSGLKCPREMGCFIRSALPNKEPNYIKRDLHRQIKEFIWRKLFHQEKRSQLLSAAPRSCRTDARTQLRNQISALLKTCEESIPHSGMFWGSAWTDSPMTWPQRRGLGWESRRNDFSSPVKHRAVFLQPAGLGQPLSTANPNRGG